MHIATGIGRKRQTGFTLTELMIATIVLLVGLIAVAQLVPASIGSNSVNRNDSTALVFAQRELEQMIEQPLISNSFTDAQGFLCSLGNSALPNQVVGNPVTVLNNMTAIDFSAGPVAGYNFSYQDPNDPYGITYDVRWAVITTVNAGGSVAARRFILGARKSGGNGFSPAVTLDTMVEK